ncbi:MAG: monovalent cation/H(+) antiporter subunit G [Oscillospiraceae bacterium]|nr:monovalent cation/H(+) antiporter subunit G [Oscillospiraceae bacterium]
MMVRFIIAAVFISVGIFIFAAATFGVFRFRYVLNRMHIAAQCDTMGALLCLVGVMILTGFTFTTLKFILCIAFIWASSPLASHLIAKAEYVSQETEDEDSFEEEVIDK